MLAEQKVVCRHVEYGTVKGVFGNHKSLLNISTSQSRCAKNKTVVHWLRLCEFSPSVTAKTARAATPMRMTNATDRALFAIMVGSILRRYPRFWL
jgi:hypothetical protein